MERNCKPVIRATANRCRPGVDAPIRLLGTTINFQTFWILILIGGGAEMISGIIHASRSKIGTLINTNKQKTYSALGLIETVVKKQLYTCICLYGVYRHCKQCF